MVHEELWWHDRLCSTEIISILSNRKVGSFSQLLHVHTCMLLWLLNTVSLQETKDDHSTTKEGMQPPLTLSLLCSTCILFLFISMITKKMYILYTFWHYLSSVQWVRHQSLPRQVPQVFQKLPELLVKFVPLSVIGQGWDSSPSEEHWWPTNYARPKQALWTIRFIWSGIQH